MAAKSTIAALGLALGLLFNGAAADGPAAGEDLAARLDRVIHDWQPSADERRFDEIGWARDIREALRLSRESGRPVFLFTYDGASMAGFRC
jgi:hypothetical protein